MGASQRKKHYIRLILPVGVTVVALIAGFFLLAGDVILGLSREKMTSKSENYADYINRWSERILSELSIYKTAADKEGVLDGHAFDILSKSYGSHSEYPFGVYWGDEYSNFYDASGWDPGPEYVPSSRNWYIEGLNHPKFAFGEPYIDVRTGRPCVSATVKMDIGSAESVLAADIYFDYAEELIARISAQEIDTAFFVSGKSRMIIASSDREQTGKTLDAENESELYRRINGLLDSGFTGLTSVHSGGAYSVNINKINDMDWYFVTCMKESAMLSSLYRVSIYILLTGAVCCVLFVFLTSRASKAFSAAEKQARTDPLTGMLNRDGFNGALSAAVENEPDKGIMLMLDVDNFKMVNDELGHTEGDAFLKELAGLLTGFFNRGRDVPARLGGDEFAVFVGRDMTRSEVSSMLGRFIEVFHEKFDGKYKGQQLSVSIGASFVSESGGDPNKAYRTADQALYKAKNSGKDQYVIY